MESLSSKGKPSCCRAGSDVLSCVNWGEVGAHGLGVNAQLLQWSELLKRCTEWSVLASVLKMFINDLGKDNC